MSTFSNLIHGKPKKQSVPNQPTTGRKSKLVKSDRDYQDRGQDPYPLLSINRLIDGIFDHGLLSFMDANSRYNQIRMHPMDEIKIAFITKRETFVIRPNKFRPEGLRRPYGGQVSIGKHKLKLNPEKCSFYVQAGKFLGYMLTRRGIEANLDKYETVINMRSPRSVKEIDRKGAPNFPIPQKERKISMDIGITALIKEDEKNQYPIYFVTKVLQGAKSIYQRLDKAALILQVLRKPDLAGRMVEWMMKLSEFDLTFERRRHVKAQILADFIAELTPTGKVEQPSKGWIILVDGASNQKGSGAKILLKGPNRVSNNQAKYEALLVGIRLAEEIGAQVLTAKSDSY
ncbi:hypothetical protein CR513_01922, partial [Mucuna pruriens]